MLVLILAASIMTITDRSDTDPYGTLPSAGGVGASARSEGSLVRFASSYAFLSYVREMSEGSLESLGFSGRYSQTAMFLRGRGPVEAAGSLRPGAPIPRPHSTTNVQERGVDEPDTVKTDGQVLAVMTSSHVRLFDVTGSAPKLRGRIPIRNGIGMFLEGDDLMVFSNADSNVSSERRPHIPERPSQLFHRSWITVTVVDIASPDTPEVVSSLDLEGGFISARMVQGVIRLVLRSAALGPQFETPAKWTEDGLREARRKNRTRIARSQVGEWVPHYVLERAGAEPETGHLHDWRAISRPPEQTGLGMVTVLTLDVDDPNPRNATSIIGSGEIVYASEENLYVTSSGFDSPVPLSRDTSIDEQLTRIHRFDIGHRSGARYVGSGSVPGSLLGQFALSEHEGVLRVASTTWAIDGTPTSESLITTLRLRDGALPRIGSIGDLGRDEQIYAVRFIGERGYVVTFRQVDPLYVIDLSTPARPRKLGELKIPGYSAYLHPIDPELLLGVGNHADTQGRRGGVQFSLFDVSDPRNPRRLHERVAGVEAYSAVEQDHRAFLYWEPTGLLVVPATLMDRTGNEAFSGLLALTVDRERGFSEPRRIRHARASAYFPVTRAVVVGDGLISVSESGLLVNDLASLEQRAWIPFTP